MQSYFVFALPFVLDNKHKPKRRRRSRDKELCCFFVSFVVFCTVTDYSAYYTQLTAGNKCNSIIVDFGLELQDLYTYYIKLHDGDEVEFQLILYRSCHKG